MKKIFLSLAAVGALSAGSAEASVLWTFTETGGDVVGTYSGSLDITGLAFWSSGFTETSVNPFVASMLSGATSTDVYSGLVGPTSFGSTNLKTPGTGSGSAFGIYGSNAGLLVLEGGYTSGDAISGTLTFSGATFASLGVDQGTYVYSLPNDTVTLQIGNPVGAVPLTRTRGGKESRHVR